MAQAITKKRTTKRQPTKRKLPSLSVNKKTPSKRAKKVTIPVTRTKTLQLTFKLTTTKKRKLAQQPSRSKIVSVVMILAGLTGLFYAGNRVFNQPILQAQPSQQSITVAAPSAPIKKSLTASNATQLQIPDIGINTTVALVGKRADGALEVPTDSQSVGQYKYAPTPGETGPAIITGHVDSIAGPAVFWRLRELVPGQVITITRADGVTATFKVDSVKDFAQNNFPSQEVYGDIDYPGLRLITCGGTFNYLTRHYSNNTVVFASLVI